MRGVFHRVFCLGMGIVLAFSGSGCTQDCAEANLTSPPLDGPELIIDRLAREEGAELVIDLRSAFDNTDPAIEVSECESIGRCAPVPRWPPDWHMRAAGPVTVKVQDGSGWTPWIEISLPEESRPDCEREIEAVAIWLDTGGLTYRAAVCLPNSHECMDRFAWQFVEEWELFSRTCNECGTAADRCDGCEFRVWPGTSDKGRIAMNSLCAGRMPIRIYAGREFEYVIQNIDFLVWYKPLPREP